MTDFIEIWVGNKSIYRMPSSFAPVEGDLLNIAKQTYVCVGRSFTIDYSASAAERSIRCNVIVEPCEGGDDRREISGGAHV